MTNSENSPQLPSVPTVLKTDTQGRVLTPPDEREALLDAFEAQNELSAPQFARQRGLNYQTFAAWRQKRAKQRAAEQMDTGDTGLGLTEVVLAASPPRPALSYDERLSTGLRVELPGGGRVTLQDIGQVALAAKLIQALSDETQRI